MKKYFGQIILIMILVSFAFSLETLAIDSDGDGNPDLEDIFTSEIGTSSGITASGDILVDVGHGEYITLSSCSTLFNNLAGMGYSAVEFNGTITDAVLAGYKALIIGTPRANQGSNFASGEITAIKNFVQNGGGVFLGGDYLNPPINDNKKINSISTSFGMTFNQDKIDPVWPIITDFATHEITQGIRSYGVYGACTMSLSKPAIALAKYGANIVSAVAEVGNGRIFGVDDWNLFSDSYISDYDNLQFASNAIVWLLGEGDLGSIEGYVTDANTGNAIQLALVIAIQQPAKEFTLSNSNGYYRIDDLPVGDWWVIVIKKGYKAGIAKVTVNAGQTTAKDFVLQPEPSE
jgi:hypothetical protein